MLTALASGDGRVVCQMTYTEGSKPPCPLCQSQDSRTLKTRWVPDKSVTWRRRECLQCGARFSTHEMVLLDEATVRLRPGRLG